MTLDLSSNLTTSVREYAHQVSANLSTNPLSPFCRHEFRQINAVDVNQFPHHDKFAVGRQILCLTAANRCELSIIFIINSYGAENQEIWISVDEVKWSGHSLLATSLVESTGGLKPSFSMFIEH